MASGRLTPAAALCTTALVAAALAGCGSARADHVGGGTSAPTLSRPASPAATATTAQPLPAGQQGSLQQVPWTQVGPGWILAEWQPTITPGAQTSLFLVDPAGGRYLIESFPASPSASTPDVLVAWSGDGQRALLKSGDGQALALLDLRTLATATLGLGSGVAPIGFTAPNGLAIIASRSNGSGQSLERFSLTGQLELSYAASFVPGGSYNGGPVLYSPDGTELAVGTSAGIELMSNEGQGLRYLNVSPSVTSCEPVRWWNTGEVLASCAPSGSGTSQLWLVPASGAAATALTASPPASGDLGDLDAWQLPAGTYVQDAGACGYIYLAKRAADGLTSPVAMPGVPGGDSTIVLGAEGNRLAIDAKPACREGASLLWYTPATNSVTPILGGAANGGTTEDALMFGEP